MGDSQKSDMRLLNEVEALRTQVAELRRDYEERQKVEEALRYRIAFEELITAISTKFINLPSAEIDTGIDDALRVLGEFVGADRSYVFLYSDDGSRMTNSHEWCAEGIVSAIPRLQDLPVDAFPWFNERMKRHETFYVPRVDRLPPEAEREQREWEAESIQSLICVPMICARSLIGFAGFDSVRQQQRWPEEVIALLRITGEILANALQRKRTEKRLSLLSSAIEQSTEGIAVGDLNGNLLYANDAFAGMHGYTPEELLHRNLSILHTPAQMPAVEKANLQIRETGEFAGEIWHSRRDGAVFPTFMRNSIVRDHTGRPVAMIATARDITAHKQAEEALRFTRFAIDHAGDCAFLIEADARFRYVNEAACRSLGYSRDELLTMSVHDIDPDFPAEVWADHWREIKDRGPFTLESRHRTKDGRVFPVEVTVNFVEFEGKEYNCAFARDITERKRAEEALRTAYDGLEKRVEERTADLTAANRQLQQEISERERAERKLREQGELLSNILSNVPHDVFWKDRDSVYLGCNQSFARTAGIEKPEDIIGKTDYDLAWKKEEADFYRQCDREVMTTGQAMLNFEEPELRADGVEATVLTSKVPLRNQKGEVVGILGIYADITDLKQAEAALRESEQRLQGILNNTKVVIYEKDLSGRYLFANRRFEELFHLSQADAIGKTDYQMFPKSIADALWSNDQRVLTECSPIEFEEVVPQDDGNHTYVSLKFPLFDPDGVPYAVCGLSTDISERERAAEELRRAKEAAEAAARAKSRFLANMSHEIRTPITAMLGAAELLPRSDPKERDRRTEIILRNGQHLLSLVDDLLDLSRLEATGFEVERVPCSLPELFADIKAVTAPLHSDRAVDLQFIYETPIPTHIYTDPTRLKQAIINLINNALKFTDAGHVWVRVRVNRERPEPTLSVAVEDTGIGIARDDIDRIFKAFTQLESSTARVSEGVGLGLPLVRWIANRLGGRLEVASEEGQGSIFTLTVLTGPLEGVEWMSSAETASLDRPVIDYSPPHSEERLRGSILLAEDSKDARDLIGFALTEAGADVTLVENGEEAVRAANEQSFDLILMDIRMPRKDGFAATAELRRQGCSTPIVALTASSDTSDRGIMLERGFTDFWQKPIPLRRLVKLAGAYLGKRVGEAVGEQSPDTGSRASKQTREARLAALGAEFESTLPLRLRSLRDALEQRDHAAAQEIIHQLAGTAGIYGHMSVSHEAARLMELANKETLADRPGELRRLEELIVEITEKNREAGGTGTSAERT